MLSLGINLTTTQVYGQALVKANASASVSFNGFPAERSGGSDKQDSGKLFLDDFGTAPMVAKVTALMEADETDESTGVRLIGRAEAECEARPGLLRIRSSALATFDGLDYSEFSVRSDSDEWVLGPSGPGTRFQDLITVRGAVTGVPVEVTITAVFEGSTTRGGGEFSSSIRNQGSFQVSSTAEGGGISFFHYGTDGSYGADGSNIPFSYSGSSVVTANVDEPFYLIGDVRAKALAARSSPGTAESIFESLNTGRVFLSVPEGYSIETASGHDYAAESAPTGPFDAWVSAAGMTGEDAARTASPRGDGVANLLKFAFNMDPSATDVRRLTPGGAETAGLPCGQMVVLPDGRNALKMEYVRRKASSAPGIQYAVQFSSDLQTWTESGLPETTTSIDATWERVSVTDDSPPGSSRRMGRVRIE